MSLTSIANPASNPQAFADKLSMLSTEQLQRLAQTKDMAVVAAVMGELNRRKQVTTAAQGQQAPQATVHDQMLSGMAPQRLPEETGIAQLPAPNMQRMADGGIVAFADRGAVEEEERPTIGSLLSRGLSGIGSDIGSAWDATKRGISSLLPSQRQYAPREAAWLAAQPTAAAEAFDAYPVPQGGPRGTPGSVPQPEVTAEDVAGSPAGSPVSASRASGLAGAASALKLPTFNTREQSITEIGKEMEPFMAQRRKENEALLKPEQDSVNALLASIAESKKGDVRQQLLGISAGFLSSKSPYFAHGAGEAIANYMNVSKEQKKFNADAAKEATAAQTALTRYRVALDKGDEATAAKYKEIATNRAERAIGHQLTGIGLGIQKQQADQQGAYQSRMAKTAEDRLQIAKDAGAHDIKIGQEFTKIQKQVDDMLAKDTNYTMASPEQQEIMRNAALQEKAKNHPLLSKLSGNIGFASGPTGKTYDLTGEMGS